MRVGGGGGVLRETAAYPGAADPERPSMRTLLACTCPLAIIAAATAVQAETSIATKATAPVKTSTVKSGAPDDVKITAAGSVVIPSGVGVTIDSNHKVTNQGLIEIAGANNATGILAVGAGGGIVNSGKIELLETYTPVDTDKDGDLDGPFAQGANRFGIRIAPGGAFTGDILNGGTISIEGNDSAGIAVDSALTGSLTSSGGVAVVGDRSVGIRAGEVTGNVRLTGTIGVTGAGAKGVALGGDVGGALTVQGTINATGYRYTTPPADPTKLDADDLLQGGPALHVGGNVAKGILLDAPPADKNPDDKDEDKDGVEDSKEGTASIYSYGAAPALLVGAADRAVAIGAVTGNANGHGIVINGTVAGRGLYNNVDATAVRIGGLGGAVTVAGGVTVNGGVGAQSKASATGLHVGSGATVPELRVGGVVRADGGAGETARSRAILIDAGSSVSKIVNTGTIAATTSDKGTAAAIVDLSGNVTLIENKGNIGASGVALSTGRALAIDLSANTAGATVRQATVGQGVATPLIHGNILFGAGDDLLDLADGEVKGTTQFGAGANRLSMGGDAAYAGDVRFAGGADRIDLAGTSAFTGAVDFGGGADRLTLDGTSRFTGTLSGSGGLAVEVNGGTLQLSGTGTTHLASLSVGAQGTIGVTIDAAAGKATLYDVAGAASFAQGAKLQVKLANVSDSVGSFTVIKADSLTGAAGLSATSVQLPVFFKSSLAVDQAAGEVDVVIARKSGAELGFNASESGAWNAIFDVLDSDAKVAGAFLAMADGETLRSAMQQMLPDHAGGVFETVTQGSRATARFLRDPGGPFADQGAWGFWLQQVAWGTSKDLGDTAAYDISGWGAAAGAELKLGGAGNVGLSLAYLNGEDANGENDNQVRASQYELGGYWRAEWGGLRAYARASAARIGLGGTRTFSATVANELVTRTAEGDWDGQLYSAAGGASYELRFGRLSLRPAASIDYYRLKEDGYTETGGGTAMNLTVDARTSDELAGEATLTAGYDLGGIDQAAGWFRVEAEAGRRQILGGELGSTTARFGTGTPFTLSPEARTDGWLGRLRLMGGGDGFSVGGELSAEEQDGRAAVAGRVALQIGF